MELAGLSVWCFAIAAIGGLAGLVLGNLRLPLVIALASSPAAGGGANIAISSLAAATASATHIRAGRVNWRLFAWMAPPSIAGALAGGYLAGVAPERALLVVVAGAAGSIPGAFLGARLTGRLTERQLVRALAIVLLVAAAATGAQALR